MRLRSLVGFSFVLMATVAGVAADEWRVDKLRGLVFVHHEGQWLPLERGDIVSDERVIRTLPSGRVEFVRDEERIELAGDSQIQIKDAERSRFTTVEQWYGKVTIQAEKQNVQHFSVETPFLAAVVKGTRFTVTSRDGQSRVAVEEGTVQVRDELYEVVTDVQAGQRADVAPGNMLEVSGEGPKAPVVTIDTGEVVTQAIREAIEDGDVQPGEIGAAVANVAAGIEPGNGLGRGDDDRGNGNSNRNDDSDDDSANSGSNNSGNGNGNGNGNGKGNSGHGNDDESGSGGNSGSGNGTSGKGHDKDDRDDRDDDNSGKGNRDKDDDDNEKGDNGKGNDDDEDEDEDESDEDEDDEDEDD
jgi:hypothetical protein